MAKKSSSQRAYTQAHGFAVAMLSAIEELVHGLPATNGGSQSITWEQVGRLNELNCRLRATVDFLEGRRGDDENG